MADTVNLGLPLVAPAQAQKHVTVNEALARLDGLTHLTLVSISQTAPPGSVQDGAAYGVPTGATGAWLGYDGKVAIGSNGGWVYVSPQPGWRAWIADQAKPAIHGDSGWRPGMVIGAQGGTLGLRCIDAELVASGGTVTATALLPARAIVFGVTSWVVEQLTGASAYQVGVPGEVSKFGGSLSMYAGFSNIGVVGPYAIYSDTDVVVTAQSGSFTGGKVRLSALILEPGPAPV